LITHAHGDHLFGVGQMTEAFPDARAVATPATAAGAVVQAGPESVGSFWEPLFPGQVPERLPSPDPVAVVAGHKNPDRADDPVILAETAAYLRDFNSLGARTGTARELYAAMLERYPRRANPGSLWGGAKKAKQPG
jgi:phosphoribosyl 1,2-cyclic phosphodiesterase